MFLKIFVSFQKNYYYLCIFPISYKCKYVLFYVNMLRLFQEINIFFSLRLS
jgi:hypothetical protein